MIRPKLIFLSLLLVLCFVATIRWAKKTLWYLMLQENKRVLFEFYDYYLSIHIATDSHTNTDTDTHTDTHTHTHTHTYIYIYI